MSTRGTKGNPALKYIMPIAKSIKTRLARIEDPVIQCDLRDTCRRRLDRDSLEKRSIYNISTGSPGSKIPERSSTEVR